MNAEKAFPEAAPKPMPSREPTVQQLAPLKHEPRIDHEMLDTLLAERDVQIAELQQAIVELSNQNDERASAAVRPELAAAQAQIARLEAKVFEQERTIRQTLTMLIEWIETEMDQTKAA
jgi:general secretion pathway protein A